MTDLVFDTSAVINGEMIKLAKSGAIKDSHMDGIKDNAYFYSNAEKYFGHLRRSGQTDYGFEDEFFFTMPAISNSS